MSFRKFGNMKHYYYLLFVSASLMAACQETAEPDPEPQLLVEDWQPLKTDGSNPLLDFWFTADPTAVEHDGRLYLYATNDQEQFDSVGAKGSNTYEKIRSLVMMSTADMRNWTFHGLIPTGEIAPWIIASWAPSVCSRVEQDGKTHFYLYFSNSGFGTGVLTATSPVGPWSSPLESSLVDAQTPGLGDCKVPFDPGVVIDENGVGWLAFGAGRARICRLDSTMTAVARASRWENPFVELPAPYHFEANELNYINQTWVYTYNMDWTEHKPWKQKTEVPKRCVMTYMTSQTPLKSASWQYRHDYLDNPMDQGLHASNNHTHLHKFRGEWYLFYHTTELQRRLIPSEGGFRDVRVERAEVDEDSLLIRPVRMTEKGVPQIAFLSPYERQEAETTAATRAVDFRPMRNQAGNMYLRASEDTITVVRLDGVDFGGQRPSALRLWARGRGRVEVRLDSINGTLVFADSIGALLLSEEKEMTWEACALPLYPAYLRALDAQGTQDALEAQDMPDVHDLYFFYRGASLEVDAWRFE